MKQDFPFLVGKTLFSCRQSSRIFSSSPRAPRSSDDVKLLAKYENPSKRRVLLRETRKGSKPSARESRRSCDVLFAPLRLSLSLSLPLRLSFVIIFFATWPPLVSLPGPRRRPLYFLQEFSYHKHYLRKSRVMRFKADNGSSRNSIRSGNAPTLGILVESKLSLFSFCFAIRITKKKFAELLSAIVGCFDVSLIRALIF